jgi:hypothetical protein
MSIEDLINKDELEIFNKLCEKLIKVNYADIEELYVKSINVQVGYFLLVKSLRNMNKKQLRDLFYNVGLKQVMKISITSTKLTLNSIVKNDKENSSRWKIISEGIL